ncbi:ThiF family adenylyltransferase [Streptomyces thinghirensis]|uniref:ThiF family adenylyltransferase n=1 Tax=Streptomyces thinghirensis TaxID=551547 RepID=A0ABP9TEF1_9ACTN
MTKRKPPAPQPNAHQQQMLAELKTLSTQHPADIRLAGRPHTTPNGPCTVPIRLRTGDMPHAPGGLRLGQDEDFLLVLAPTPLTPPRVETTHLRFAGTPHILQGNRLCLYLDPAREWDPSAGLAPVMNRLWQWLTDAAAAKFDPDTALYHPVGGVLHHTPGTPTIVVRDLVPNRPASIAWLTSRTQDRLDLTTNTPTNQHSHRTPVLLLNHSLPLGAGSTLAELITLIDGTPATAPPIPNALSHTLLTVLAASARRNTAATAQHFLLAVPHPATPASPPFLLAARLEPDPSDALRHLDPRTPPRPNTLPTVLRDATLTWCPLSDERPEVTTRRDAERPAHSFHGTHVHIWGCGGIGSWTAELIARAGARHLTLSDPGHITGGLLVRQNYTENDIGTAKATALAQRLRSLRDDLTIDITEPPPAPSLLQAAEHADLIIDTTVNITAGRFLDLLAQAPHRKAVLAQLATDSHSASLGILTLVAPDTHTSATAIDQASGHHVLTAPHLEPYHCLWTQPAPGDELNPTRGCSVPTFHGSAADLMATTATLVNVLGTQMRHPVSGTHLCAQPHTGTHPAHHFIAYADPP